MKDIPLSNYTAERQISDMAEDTEIEKSKLFTLQLGKSTDIQNNSILLMYVRYTVSDESDMKEDNISVSELPIYTTSNEVLSGFIEEINLKWKKCVGVCTHGAACLTVLVTKIKDMRAKSYCQQIVYSWTKIGFQKYGT
jgi:hypothetical protein